jgi:hypothetical protein
VKTGPFFSIRTSDDSVMGISFLVNAWCHSMTPHW